jgi:hypothetical protein
MSVKTSSDEILAAMERTAFELHTFEIPVGTGLALNQIPRKRCSCGRPASVAIRKLEGQDRVFLCERCGR